MGKLKDPARLWMPGNLIPTTTHGSTVHAVVLSRKTAITVCRKHSGQRFWEAPYSVPQVKTTEDPLGWVNCRNCLRVGWMKLIDFAPPGMCTQPSHPDSFFAAMSHEIEKARDSEKRQLWLILADWFDEQGDPRGELIRCLEEIKLPPDDYDEHPLRRVQIINRAWRLDEQIWPNLWGLDRPQRD